MHSEYTQVSSRIQQIAPETRNPWKTGYGGWSATKPRLGESGLLLDMLRMASKLCPTET